MDNVTESTLTSDVPTLPAAVDGNAPPTDAAPAVSTSAEAVEARPSDAEKEAQERDGARFAALKRRERAAVAAERKAAEVASKVGRYQAAIDSNDPDKLLEAFGITGDKLVDLYVRKHSGDEEKPKAEPTDVEKKIAALEAKLAEREKAEGESKVAATVREHISAIKDIAVKGGDKYELVNAEGAHEMAFDVMAEYHKQFGTFLSYVEALDAVETQLESDAKAHLERLAKVKKLQPHAGTVTATDNRQATRTKGDAEQRMRDAFKQKPKAVTNAASSGAPTTLARPRNIAEADARFHERVAALAAMRG